LVFGYSFYVPNWIQGVLSRF